MAGQAVKGIDHVVVVVADIEAARVAYARLGFQVQPRGFHARLGTANHLMIFQQNYFELIGIVEPNPLNAERRAWLERNGGGLANAALRTDGAELAHAAWAAAGLQPDAVLEFSRAVEIDGRQEQAAFRTVRLATQRARLLGFFVCEHLTPQFVYRPEWARHANGVEALAGATVIAADPASDEAYLRKVFGNDAVRTADGELVVDSGGTPIRYMTRERFGALYPGIAPQRADDHPALLSFAVSDLAQARAVLRDADVAHAAMPDGRVLVPAAAACGVCIEFRKR
ncbi:MAG: VOC family protein [Alphaproteobacteria bacterium]|nr:VOC family protein [Alphaproteobacteria bacterium]